MKLILNEQEVTDGICVYVADEAGGYPEYVEVKEIEYTKDNKFYAKAYYIGKQKYDLGMDEIEEGIRHFLVVYHTFNENAMKVKLVYTEGQGIGAEVLVNE